MEKLQITGCTRRTLQYRGNTVLHAEFPTLSGDTPAAEHAHHILSALWEFAEQGLADSAAAALLAAAKEGRLFSFTPHKMTVKLTKEIVKRGTLLTLTLTVTANGKESRTLRHFLWTADESLRKRSTGVQRRHRKAGKNA